MTDTLPWDCHVHVIGDRERFPLSPSRGYEPPDAPVEALLDHLEALGAEGAVIVQPSVYGFDNSCLLDALARCDGRAVGVCVPDPGLDRDGLKALHRGGVRGLRCNLINPGGLRLDQTQAWWSWMRDHGWHLQVQIDASRFDVAQLTERPGLPPLVIDHMGYPPRGSGPHAIGTLISAVLAGQVHVKLSAPYRLSATPPPHPDALALAEALLDADAERCLFASDWPHTETETPPMPAFDWLANLRLIAGARWDNVARASERLYGAVNI